jgi:mRNA interferase RelE/StbE
LALNIKLATTAHKYLTKLDKNTQHRIADRLKNLAETPLDFRLSYPLKGSTKRSSRVGNYRILFEIDNEDMIVADIGPRGQIYRRV